MKKIKIFPLFLAVLLMLCAVPSVYAVDPCTTHSYGGWTVTVEPGCTTEGVKTRTCSVCGYKDEAAVPAKGHNTVTETVQPTCTESGHTRIYCPACGYQYSNTVIPATGHSAGNRKVTSIAAAGSNGSTTVHCTVCGELLEEGIYTLDDPAVNFVVSSPEEYQNGLNSVDVSVVIKNNPGIWGASFYLYFDPVFSFVSSENGTVFSNDNVLISENAIKVSDSSWASSIFELDGTEIGNRKAINYYAESSNFTDNTANGTLFTVKLAYDSSLDGTYSFGFAYDPGSVINSNGDDVDVLFVGGEYTIQNATEPVYPGDVNGDGKLNSRDIAVMKRCIASSLDDKDVVITANADINGDGKINSRDLSALKRLIAG
ncbi:MAG: hypothetical protein IJS45_04850 [Clostridia bacterium]|nr:hypothetical protein [Clostridia bacterium]